MKDQAYRLWLELMSNNNNLDYIGVHQFGLLPKIMQNQFMDERISSFNNLFSSKHSR